MKFFNTPILLTVFCTFLLGCDSPVLNLKDRQPSEQKNEKVSIPCEIIFSQLNLCGSLDWINAPSTNGESIALLNLTHKDPSSDLKMDGLKIKVVLWMPEHMHGSAPTKTVNTKQKNQFSIENMWFIMPGKWDITIQIFDEKELLDEVSITVYI